MAYQKVKGKAAAYFGKRFYCQKCRSFHLKNSKIGRAHRQYDKFVTGR